MMMTDDITFYRDPKEVRPVHIRDFLGDFTNLLSHNLKNVYDMFNPQYRVFTSNKCAIKWDGDHLCLFVTDPMKVINSEELLHELWFEKAMKQLPLDRIIKVCLTVFDEKENVEYKTNGIRLMVRGETNFTSTILELISQIHPESKGLKLVQLDIQVGMHALACDEIPNYHSHSEDPSYPVSAAVEAKAKAVADEIIRWT